MHIENKSHTLLGQLDKIPMKVQQNVRIEYTTAK